MFNDGKTRKEKGFIIVDWQLLIFNVFYLLHKSNITSQKSDINLIYDN